MKGDGNPRTAIIAALPQELKTLTRYWPRQSFYHGKRQVQLAWTTNAVAVCAGIGSQSVEIAMEEAANLATLTSCVSVGFAGALDEDAPVGKVFRPSAVIAAETGERFTSAAGDGSVCVTSATVAGAEEKAELAARFSADLVDMEAAFVARNAAERDLPFFAIKVISDPHDFTFPALQRFTTADGRFRVAAFAAYVATHPGSWSLVSQLAQATAKAEPVLAAAIEQLLNERS